MNLEQAFEGSMTRRRKLQDMAKTKVETEEDYRKYMDRMPEIKMEPDKVSYLLPNQLAISHFTFFSD